MKKTLAAVIMPLSLVALALPLTACVKSETSSSVSSAPSASVSSSSSESVESGDTMITLTAPDRGVGVGESMALTSHVYGPNAKISYVSSDPTIATVDEKGVVTGVKPGFVSIRAVSALSTDDNPIYGLFTLFVEPAYIVSMVKGFRGNDYKTGLNFSGKLRIMTGPATGTATEEKSSLIAPYTFALKTNSYPENAKEPTYTLPSFDLRLSTTGGLESYVGIILKKSGYSAKNVCLSSLDLSSPVFYSEENTEQGLFGVYEPFSFYEKISAIIPQISTIAPYFDSATGVAQNLPTFLESAALALNENLATSEDGAEGVYVKDVAIQKINDKWPSVIDAIKNSTTLSSVAKAILPGVLPTSFKDIRMKVTTSSDAFSSLQFQITAYKKNSKDELIEYHPLTIDLNAPTTLGEGYFTTLSSRFTVADADTKTIATVTAAESTLYDTLTAYRNDVYNALHFSTRFLRNVKSYNADTYPSLSSVVNTPLIPNDHSLVYGPYENFNVTRQADTQKNVLMDSYAASAGESFVLSDVVPVGSSESSFSSTVGYTLSLSDPSATLADYATLANGVLTINKLPTDSKMTLSVTPETVTGHVPVTYKIVLNKVSA